MPDSAMPNPANPVLLYDGVCGLCNGLVRFVLRHDTAARFRFASLQSAYAAAILQRHGLDPDDLDTVYVVSEGGQLDGSLRCRDFRFARTGRLLERHRHGCLRILPKSLRDWGYAVVARHRYRIFGKYETCLLPEKKYRDRFLDA